jgi:hypothetical protein
VSLETTFGTMNFGVIVALVTIATQLIFLGISWSLYASKWYEPAMFTYTVGFSGTIFGLKVICNALDENAVGFGLNRFFSFDLPWSKVVWVELLFAQLASPNSSFLGHLSGILAGMLITPLLPTIFHNQGLSRFFRSRPRFWGWGNARRDDRYGGQEHRNDDDHGGLEAMSPDAYLSPDEVRRRRLERLNGASLLTNVRGTNRYQDQAPQATAPRFRGSGTTGRGDVDPMMAGNATLSPEELRQRRLNRFT